MYLLLFFMYITCSETFVCSWEFAHYILVTVLHLVWPHGTTLLFFQHLWPYNCPKASRRISAWNVFIFSFLSSSQICDPFKQEGYMYMQLTRLLIRFLSQELTPVVDADTGEEPRRLPSGIHGFRIVLRVFPVVLALFHGGGGGGHGVRNTHSFS